MADIANSVLRLIRLVTEKPRNQPIKFRIIHRFRKAGTICLPGEEIGAVYLIFRDQELFLPLSLALRILFDYMAHHRHLPQNATQIAAGIKASIFYSKHGKNTGVLSRRKICRSAIKEYIKRIRKSLNLAFPVNPHPFDASQLLVSTKTVGNEVQYRLCAPVEWVHVQEMPL